MEFDFDINTSNSDLDKKVKKVIIFDRLYLLEEKIAELYKVYAGKLSNSEFWLKLEEDEHKHAQMILKLRQFTDEIGDYDQNRWNVEPINYFIESVERKIDHAKNNDVSLHNAMGEAKNIEFSLLEKKFYETISSDNDEVKKVFSEMKNEIFEHQQFVKQECESLGIPTSAI